MSLQTIPIVQGHVHRNKPHPGKNRHEAAGANKRANAPPVVRNDQGTRGSVGGDFEELWAGIVAGTCWCRDTVPVSRRERRETKGIIPEKSNSEYRTRNNEFRRIRALV